MKNSLLTTLRDKKTSIEEFRKAALALSDILAAEIAEKTVEKSLSIQTPFAKFKGSTLSKKTVIIPILRSGLVLLPSFINYFPASSIGFLGILRDEKTAKPSLYYQKLPKINPKDCIILLDPMIATGKTAILAITRLQLVGVKPENITLVSVIASKIGIQTIQKKFPKTTLSIAAIDDKLNSKKFIVPGLGDFGDRFFGTC